MSIITAAAAALAAVEEAVAASYALAQDRFGSNGGGDCCEAARPKRQMKCRVSPSHYGLLTPPRSV